MRFRTIIMVIALSVLVGATGSRAQGPRILFIRGANGTGGLVGGNDNHLTDIANSSTAAGNTGWGSLASLLTTQGYGVEQAIEGGPISDGCVNVGAPLDFAALATLAEYDVLVFGSNNARYPAAQVQAITAFIRHGGAVLFVSDANYGRDWRTAAHSDQDFLSTFGLVMNQDTGTYTVRRASEFVVPGHPILAGVETFDGEGVSPIRVASVPAAMRTTIVARARNQTRENNGTCGVSQGQGTVRNVTAQDAALVVVEWGLGRIAAHFDRNTFFNANGAGTSLVRFENTTYTLNLFAWLSAAGSVRYASWAAALPPALADFAQDADADGLANGLEYTLASDALDGAQSLPVVAKVGAPGAERFEVQFEIAAPPRGDTTIEVQTAEHLESASWETIATKPGFGAWEGAASVVEGVVSGARQTVTVQEALPVGARARFFRLRITRTIPS